MAGRQGEHDDHDTDDEREGAVDDDDDHDDDSDDDDDDDDNLSCPQASNLFPVLLPSDDLSPTKPTFFCADTVSRHLLQLVCTTANTAQWETIDHTADSAGG
jgi:hypothetical protein